jgi:hypothetical protein
MQPIAQRDLLVHVDEGRIREDSELGIGIKTVALPIKKIEPVERSGAGPSDGMVIAGIICGIGLCLLYRSWRSPVSLAT